MVAPEPILHAIVVADDAVEAGMLALDLVQAGFDAHAAASEAAAIDQLASLSARADVERPAVVAAYQDLRRTSVLSRRLVSAGLTCKFVAVINDRDRQTAESESVLLDWDGVVMRPPDMDLLGQILRSGADAAPPDPEESSQEGNLAGHGGARMVEHILGQAASHPTHRDAVVQFANGSRHGQVAIVAGDLVHAQADQDTGRHALERICCWNRGTWRVTWTRYGGQHTIRGGRGALAAATEYARRVERTRESIPHRNAICTVRWERVRPLPVVAEALFHRIAAGNLLEKALDGEGDDELEALTALLSRIRRGAVNAQASAVQTQTHSSLPFARPRVASRPTRALTALKPETVVPSATVAAPRDARRSTRTEQTSHYEIPPVSRPGAHSSGRPITSDDTLTRRIDPHDLPKDLPEVPRMRARRATPSNPILPATLPEYDRNSGAYEPPKVSKTIDGTGVVSGGSAGGWFGLSVGDTNKRRAVSGIVAPAENDYQADATVNVTETVAKLPKPARRERANTSVIEAAYSNWEGDYAETEKAVEEASVVFKLDDLEEPKRKTGWMWALALVAVCAIGAVVLVPGLVSDGKPKATDADPVMHTYRQAVALIDEGRGAEAVAMLTRVYTASGVPAEALLQLAVLEIEQESYELGRAHLERYIDDHRANDAKRAKRLYEHVFGKRTIAN